MNKIFVSYVFDYFDEVPPMINMLDHNGEQKTISIEDLSGIELPIITYDFWSLVDYFRVNDLVLPLHIIDVVTAKKLLLGTPKSECKEMLPWNYWEQIRGYMDLDSYDSIKAVAFRKKQWPLNDEILDLLKVMTLSLAELWNDLCSELEKYGELRRFMEIEVPVYNVMLNTQKHGVRIDESKLDKYLMDSNKIYYKAKKKIEIEYNINIDNNNIINQFLEIENNNNNPIKKSLVRRSSYDNFIAINSKFDDVSLTFSNYRRYKLEKSILSRIVAIDSKVFPIYDICGTVTSRILVADPLLQNLKKVHRDIILPDDGCVFLYIDYSQFEPGIMASLADNNEFIELYNSSDIYSGLSELIFGTDKERDTAKKIFLSYSYGMSWSSIKDILSIIVKEIKNNSSIDIDKVKSSLAVFETMKHEIHDELIKNNRIGTLFGNYRYRQKTGDLSNREKRYAVSQVVQGTASLIIKKVILDINKNLPSIRIVLPMHDALLIQVSADEQNDLEGDAVEIFKRAFKEICPKINPGVTVDKFI